jgi:beta-galactosidase/beta-glucuronidase
MYLPFRKDITGELKAENELVIYFHQHDKVIAHYEKTMPPEWKGNVPASAMLMRMRDYGHRPDDYHGFKPTGIFDKVCIETLEYAELDNMDVDVALPTLDLDLARIEVTLEGKKYDDAPLSVKFGVCEKDGSNKKEISVEIKGAPGEWKKDLVIEIKNPKLWWPKNYGPQPMYKVELEISVNGEPVIRKSKPFGIRKLRKKGNMVFEFNNVPVRFWGGDIAPIWGPSNAFNAEYCFSLIDRINLAGMNAVRVWGPSQPYPNEFYDKFDELGIMVWQDFPTGGSQLPDSEEYKKLLCSEAEFMVKKLKHHPSIYLWCGGNENIYMSEIRHEKIGIGFDILTNHFRDVCAKYDPQRYYHASCPYEGRYANDPLNGDTHGSRAIRSFCAGEQYGAFFSENIRTYPPQYKSFYRWLGDRIWEEGYIDYKPFGRVKPMPEGWKKLLTTSGEEKFGPIWDYYAATNVHELIYKYTAAAGQDIYQIYARSRRGNPAHKNYEGQFCRGQVFWKITDPWPNFYCAFIDYYLEPSLPYYSAKRAIKPVWIDFEISDHIYLWGVNDTREAVAGMIELTLYNLEEEAVVTQVNFPAALLPGSSQIITDLDSFGFLRWCTLLHAKFTDQNGNYIMANNNYITKENMLPFHDAKLTMSREGDCLTITTDKFARCVEISAGEDGCAFGWVFEDNYFDLFPFETKKVRIQKRGGGSCIKAQAHYSPHAAVINC